MWEALNEPTTRPLEISFQRTSFQIFDKRFLVANAILSVWNGFHKCDQVTGSGNEVWQEKTLLMAFMYSVDH
jgi:hypothetical protein